jgi:phytoene synthase
MQRSSEHSGPTDIAACRALLKTGSRTFHAASFLLPRRVREPAYALYAFCRSADDSVDIDCKAGAIERLTTRLDYVYRGSPQAHPVDRAMMRVVEQYAIPKHVPAALIEGLAWDRAGRGYETLADLQAYAARVAGTVGVMMALVMGVRAPNTLARAIDLGIAMQLTNIARDVGEDARAGRLYLPREWLVEAGIDVEAWLAAPHFSPALGMVVDRLLETADHLYERAEIGIAGLPKGCRPGIFAARLLYAEIGQEVRRNGCDSVTQRAVVPSARKLRRLSALFASLGQPLGATPVPCVRPARFLLSNIDDHVASTAEAPGLRWWDLKGQAIWVLDLFERLEQRRAPAVPESGDRVTA